MRINTNVSALNAANNLSRVQNAVSSSMEKLSSGFRINHAADDAAGLGIANKLRADGRALSQASRNAEQTNSLLQVAEGATSTIQSILERMKELATQSGSDTVDAAGRQSINAEFTQLRDEITRTVDTTKFQGNNLLDGSFGSAPSQLSLADISVPTNGTSATGSYSFSVSGTTVTMSGPSGRSDAVDLSTLSTADYSGGKVALKFGSGTSQITVNVVADNANDITSVSNTLTGKSFTVGSGAAATHTGAFSSGMPAGFSVGTIGSGVADGTYTIVAADRQSVVGGTQNTTLTSVGSSVTAGNYSVAVTDASAAWTSQPSSLSGFAMPAGMAAGTYSFEVDDTTHTIDVKDSLGNTVASQVWASGTGSNDGDAVAFSNGGVSFNLAGTGDSDTWAHIKTNLEAASFTVTAAKIDVKQGATVIASQDLTAGYSSSSNFHFADAGSKFDFTVDTSSGHADTYAKMKAALLNAQISVTDAHIDVKNGSTIVATQSYTPVQEAAGQGISFSNSNIAFNISAGANTGWSTISSALNGHTLTVSSTAAGANTATAVTGNSTTHQASFMIDSSGQYKTNDLIQLGAMDLTVNTLGLSSSSLSTATGARSALATIDSALGTVASTLGTIGANQNRISYAQDNLKTKIANFSAAESVIRDVDMADEMTKFSKNNILAQAGTAMLAQANQAGQSVLRLLQG